VIEEIKAQLEARRFQCEVDYWWRVTAGDPRQVNEVLDRIARQRGKAGADRLREGLREKWKEKKADDHAARVAGEKALSELKGMTW